MKKQSFERSLIVLGIILILSVSSIASVSAITGAIGNGRAVVSAEVGETIERYILVKNPNDVDVQIDITASGELAQETEILDNSFNLAPGEEKKAYFNVEVTEPGQFETNLNIKYTPIDTEDKNGVGLVATLIVNAYGEGETPDNSDDENPDENPGTNPGITGNSIKNVKTPVLIVLVIITFVVFIIFIVLLSKLKAFKRDETEAQEIKVISTEVARPEQMYEPSYTENKEVKKTPKSKRSVKKRE